MSGEPEDLDLLAAEYVLGTLDPTEAEAVAARAGQVPALAAAITAWQERLAPLSRLADPVEPPADLWARIAASVTQAAPPRPAGLTRAWRSLAFWRGATVAGFAFAAGLAAFTLRQPPPEGVLAALVPPGNPMPAFVAERAADGRLRLFALQAVPVAPGKDLELWALPAGATRPVSLGLVPAAAAGVPNLPRGETQIMVSLEPRGGSPTGLPTGPVLYQGTLPAAAD